MDIITKKKEWVRKEYPIMYQNILDVLLDKIRRHGTTHNVYRLPHSVPVPMVIKSVKIELKNIVTLSYEKDGDDIELLCFDEDGNEYSEIDVYGGLISLFTWIDIFGNLK